MKHLRISTYALVSLIGLLGVVSPAHAQFNTVGKDFQVRTGTTSATASEKMRVTQSGLIGIGVATPTTPLEVSGTISATSFVGSGSGLTGLASGERIVSSSAVLAIAGSGTISQTASGNALYNMAGAGSNAIQLGQGRTDNNYAFIDLVGDPTYTDYGLRIIRGNGGANTSSAVTHRGTGTMNVTTEDAAPIVFNTTSLERMRLTQAGFLGISTPSPGALLDVSGSGLVAQFGTNQLTDQYISVRNLFAGSTLGLTTAFSTGGDAVLQSGSVKGIAFIVSGSTTFATQQPSMYITYTGNVGMGTITPSTTLHLNGANKSFVVLAMSNELSNTMSSIVQQYGGISMRSFGTALGSGGGAVLANAPSSDTYPDSVQLVTSGTTRLMVVSSGYVGIGTSAPAAQLAVKSTVNSADGLTVTNASSGTSALTTIGIIGDTGSGGLNYYSSTWNGGVYASSNTLELAGYASNNVLQIRNSSSNGIIRFMPASSTERMRITSAGNVGIGTTTPTALLHVRRSDNGTPVILGNSVMNWTVGPDTSGAFVVYNSGATGVYVTNGATTWSANSDHRLKKDITPLAKEKGLESIAKLTPVTYHWRVVGAPSATQTGFIAQDVEKVFPELVSQAPNTAIRTNDGKIVSLTDVKGLNYEGLIMPMVQSIKQLKAQNEEMSASLHQLRMEFESYRSSHP